MLENMQNSEVPREGMINEHRRVNQGVLQSFDLPAWGYDYQLILPL